MAGAMRKPIRNAAVPAACQPEAGVTASEDAGVTVRTRGRLPHWERRGATYFVTFRVAGTLPAHVLESMQQEQEAIESVAAREGRTVSAEERERLNALRHSRIEEFLDTGTGWRPLAQPEVADLAVDALRHFDGERYSLHAWAVMPNHVHVVFTPKRGHSLADILHAWKSFTAHGTNRLLRRKGRLWAREYYDHVIRGEEDFRRRVAYVLGNPAKAGFAVWRWVGCAIEGVQQSGT